MLSLNDITLEAIDAEQRRVEQLQRHADALKVDYDAAEKLAREARIALGWRRILRAIQEDSALSRSLKTLHAAITQYKASLQEPEGYTSDENVEYSATDDYADFNVVEQTVDQLLDMVHEWLEAGEHERAALQLVMISTEIGKVLEHSSELKSSGLTGIPVGEIEDCRESLVLEWHRLFFDVDSDDATLGTGTLSADAATRWHETVSNHLGPPFDSKPS